jgi:chromate transporter
MPAGRPFGASLTELWNTTMTTESIDKTSDQIEQALEHGPEPVPLLKLVVIFLGIGATTFGGMWAGAQKLEKELVNRRGWLTLEDQKALMVAAALIPAPKFLSFGGMVGFRLRGWPGAILTLSSILAPPALFVLTGAIFLNPDVLGGPLVPLQRAVGIAIVGLLFGNAYHQLKSAKVPRREKMLGVALAIAVAASAILGVPLIVAAIAGFVIGVFLIRKGKEKKE